MDYIAKTSNLTLSAENSVERRISNNSQKITEAPQKAAPARKRTPPKIMDRVLINSKPFKTQT